MRWFLCAITVMQFAMEASAQLRLTSVINATAPQYSYGGGYLVKDCNKSITFTVTNTGAATIYRGVKLYLFDSGGNQVGQLFAHAFSLAAGASATFSSGTTVVGANGAMNGLGGTTVSNAGSYTLRLVAYTYAAGSPSSFDLGTMNFGNSTLVPTQSCGSCANPQNLTIYATGVSTAPTSASASVNPVNSGSSTTLSRSGGSLGTGASWVWYSGSCGGSNVGTGTSVSVSPTSTTTYYVRAEGSCGNTTCASVTVTVNTPPGTPPNPANPTAGCGTTTITRNGTPPTNVLWYWQTTCGTSTALGSAATYNAPSSGTYYIRAYNQNTGLWSTGCGSVNITVNQNSTAPTSASANPTTINPGASSTVSVSGGALGTGASWRWYSGSCGGTLVGTGASISVSPSATTTYFVRAEGSCNTTTCASVTVNVNTPPGIPPNPANPTAGCNTTTITRNGTPPTNVLWYWQGTTASNCSGSTGVNNLGSGSTYSAPSSGTYYIRAYDQNSGLWSTGCGSVSVTVNQNSTAPTSASANPTTINPGASSTVSVNGGALGTGASWRWYSGSCGGTLVGTGASISVSPSATTTYFVRAEGSCNTTTCASVTVTVNTPPGTPPNPANPTAGCGTTTITRNGSPTAPVVWYWQGTNASNCSGSTGVTNLGSGTTYSAPSSGTYYIRAYNPNTGLWSTGCGSVSVTVNQNSTAPTSASANPTTINPGASSTLSVNGGALGTGASWRWYSGSCGGTLVGTGASVSVSPSATTTYFVRAEGSCGNTTCASVTVNVNQQLVLVGQQSSPLSGIVNVTSFNFSCSVTGGDGSAITITLELEDYGGVSIPMPTPVGGSSSISRTFSGVGNRPFRYKAVQNGQSFFYPVTGNPPLYVNVTFDCNNFSSIPNFISREQWLKPYSPERYDHSLSVAVPLINPKHIVIHHTGSIEHNTVSPYSDWAGWMRSIYNTHYSIAYGNNNEYPQFDFPYNYVIAPDGTIFEGVSNGHNSKGRYHANGVWQNSVGVAMLGRHDVGGAPPTVEAMESLNFLLGKLSFDLAIDPLSTVYNSALSSSNVGLNYQNTYGGIRTILGHQDLQSNKPNCPGYYVHNNFPDIRNQVSGCLNNSPLAYSAVNLNNSGSYMSNVSLYRKRGGELKYLGQSMEFGQRIIRHSSGDLIIGDTIVASSNGYHSMEIPLTSREFSSGHSHIPYFPIVNSGGLKNPRLLRAWNSSTSLQPAVTMKIEAGNMIGFDVLEDSTWVQYQLQDSVFQYVLEHPSVFDFDAYYNDPDYDLDVSVDPNEYFVRVRAYSAIDTVYVHSLVNHYGDEMEMTAKTFQLSVLVPDELRGVKMYVDEQFESVLISNQNSFRIRSGNHFLRFQRFGYEDHTVHLSHTDTTLILSMSELPITEDSTIFNLEPSIIKYWFNTSLRSNTSTGSVLLKKYYLDYENVVGIIPQSTTYSVRKLNPFEGSLSMLAVLDQSLDLDLDSVYLLNYTDGVFSKLSHLEFTPDLEFDSVFQKIVNMDITGENNRMVMAKKLSPIAVPSSITTNEDVAIVLPLSDFFTDPDSIPNDMTFAVTGGGSEFTWQIIGDTLYLTPSADWSGSSSIIIEATHDWLTVSQSISVDISPVNDAPIIDELEPVQLCFGSELQVNLTPFLSDADHALVDITLDAQVESASVAASVSDITVSVIGQTLQITSAGGAAGGVYQVSIIADDAVDQSNAVLLQVTVTPEVVVSIEPTSAIMCNGQAVQLWANGASAYSWTMGSQPAGSNDSLMVQLAVPGVNSIAVSVVGTEGNCQGVANFTVPVVNGPSVQLETSSTELCLGDSTLISASGATSYVWQSTEPFQALASDHIWAMPVADAFYNVTGSVGSGCDGSQSVFIEVNPLPASPQIIDLGGTLQSSEATGNQWYLEGQPLSGETGATLSNPVPGSYTVEYTDANGCSQMSVPYTVLVTGIGGSLEGNGPQVYPNPNAGTFTVRISGVHGTLGLRLMDAIGRTVSLQSVEVDGALTKEYRNVASGVYTLETVIAEERWVQRVVVY
jgi:hypothetical protein